MTARAPGSQHASRTSRVELQVDAGHRDALDAVLDSYSRAVALEMSCQPSSPAVSDAFRLHFQPLGAAVEQWNSVLHQLQAASDALWQRIILSARDYGITEPPFMVGVLIDDLATWTLTLSRRLELSVPHSVPLDHFRDTVAGSECVSVYLRGRRVAELPGGDDAAVARRVEKADALIQALFEDACAAPEAQRIVETRGTLLRLQRQLLDAFDVHTAFTSLPVVPECPECAARLAGGTAARPTGPDSPTGVTEAWN